MLQQISQIITDVIVIYTYLRIPVRVAEQVIARKETANEPSHPSAGS